MEQLDETYKSLRDLSAVVALTYPALLMSTSNPFPSSIFPASWAADFSADESVMSAARIRAFEIPSAARRLSVASLSLASPMTVFEGSAARTLTKAY